MNNEEFNLFLKDAGVYRRKNINNNQVYYYFQKDRLIAFQRDRDLKVDERFLSIKKLKTLSKNQETEFDSYVLHELKHIVKQLEISLVAYADQ